MTTGDAVRGGRRAWLPWLAGAIVLPTLGATAVVALVEKVALDTWPSWRAGAALAALFAVPGLLSAWVGRSFGVVGALAWALACMGIELALVFGVGFLALGLGPG